MFTKKSITWFVSNLVDNSYQELYEAELASTRMRAGVCARAFQTHGYQLAPICCEGSQIIPEVAFIAKFVIDSYSNQYLHDGGVRWGVWVNRLRELHAAGSQIIVDYTDNHLANTNQVGDFYRLLFAEKLVSKVVVPSKKMGENFSQFSSLPFCVIPEPIEVDFFPVKNHVAQVRTIMWFGHNSNIKFLYDFLLNQYSFTQPINLIILTNHLNVDQLKGVLKNLGSKVRCQVFKWSLGVMQKIAAQVDLVIIPGSQADPLKNGVSPGRLHTALALGLPVAATMLDSYAEYADFFCDLDSKDVNLFFSDPSIQWCKVSKAQDYLRKDFLPEVIGKLWLECAK